MTTTTWWWVRHGPTHEKAFVGWRDVPADLSDAAQIERLNAHLPQDAVLVSSDLIRATATADAISAGRLRLPHAPEFREFNFGDWDGKRFDQVAESHPELSRAYWETPGDVTAPGGESWNDAAARVAPMVEQLNAGFAGRHIIAVAHIGIIMTQVQMASGKTPYQVLGNSIDNLSVTRLQHRAGNWRVHSINHVP